MAGGRAVDAAQLTEVSTTLGAVTPWDLPHVRAADREFVAAEMTAFLRLWPTTLACPVTDAATGRAASLAGHPASPPPPPGGYGDRDPLVLLWGAPEEEPLAAVHCALLAEGARTFLVDQRRAILGLRHIGPHTARTPAQLLDLACRALRRLLTELGHRDIRTQTRKLERDRAPNPSPRARNDRYLPLEVHVHSP